MASQIISCTLGPGASIHFDGLSWSAFSSGGISPAMDRGRLPGDFPIVAAVNVGYFEVHALALDGSCYLFKADSGILQISKIG